jgi:preprotein translocase subunit SecE
LSTLSTAPPARSRRRRSGLSVFAFAALFLALFLGLAFAAGYIVGKLLL